VEEWSEMLKRGDKCMMFKQAEFFGRICDQNWCGLGVVCDDDLVMFILQCPS